MKKMLGFLQQIGKSLMLPVATLPAAGILLALGSLLKNPDLLESVPFFATDGFQLVATVLGNTGGIVFGNLPVLFTVAVAIGLTKNDGAAALSGVIGYLMMNMAIGAILGIDATMVSENGQAYANILGINTLQTGVFGGIIAGIIAAYCFNKYFKIELPEYLGFFSGKRFVPMATAVFSIIAAIVLSVIWPVFQTGLNAFSTTVISANLTVATFLFGLIERSLIPFGLHHVFYAPFWFQFGEYVSTSGQSVFGDQSIFFQQMRDGAELTAGAFMTGKFPFMMFGLPAAGLAMYHCADADKKKAASGILLSAALTSFLTGITEPIEFAFLFLAPGLFMIHSVFAGISFAVMNLLNVKIGMTLSGGLIDYILFGALVNRTDWWLVIPVGLAFSALYYFTFKWYILKFNVPTPGREKTDSGAASALASVDNRTIAWNVVAALGGLSNLKNVDACITRLRLEMVNNTTFDESRLRQLGAVGVVKVGSGLQVIFGAKAQVYANEINEIISQGLEEPKDLLKIDQIEVDKHARRFDAKIYAPTDGEIIQLSQVNDPVFAEKMMGDGFAVIPDVKNNRIYSPVEGEVISVFPTKHAIGLRTSCGLEVLLHIGLDTVSLNGDGFEPFVSEGDYVKVGDHIFNVDYDYLQKVEKDVTLIIVFTNLADEKVNLLKTGKTVHSQDLIVDFDLI